MLVVIGGHLFPAYLQLCPLCIERLGYAYEDEETEPVMATDDKDSGDDLHSYYANKLRYKMVPQIDASEVAPEVYIPRNSKDPSVNP